MKHAITALLIALLLTGCSTTEEKEARADQERLREQRVLTVAKNLVADGKAADIEAAKPIAEEIVTREIAEQKAVDHENAREANFFNESDKRAE